MSGAELRLVLGWFPAIRTGSDQCALVNSRVRTGSDQCALVNSRVELGLVLEWFHGRQIWPRLPLMSKMMSKRNWSNPVETSSLYSCNQSDLDALQAECGML